MKKIATSCLTFLAAVLSMCVTLKPAAASSVDSITSAPASMLHSFFNARLFATATPAATPIEPQSSSSYLPGFPLPAGMKSPPPILSADITSAILMAVSAAITPELIAAIKAPLAPEKAPAPLKMGSFQPVGPPIADFSTSPAALSAPASVTPSAPTSKQVPNTPARRLQPKSFAGEFDITSRYVFRGISKSSNSGAFQGGFAYTFLSTGTYFKVWGSNVDFLSRQGQLATVEADTSTGIKNKIGKDLTYDLSVIRYNYPKAAGANYNEFVSLFSYKILKLTLGYSPNAFNSHANGLYYNGGVDIPLPEKYVFQYTNVFLMGNYGHYNLSKEAGFRSYSDFMLGIRKSVNQYTLMLQWAGTNGEAKLKGLDADRLVGTVCIEF